jgi:multidrug transporter EmrE-like cation transporter
MSRAYLELAGSVLFNVASYLVYKSIVGAASRIWWPLFIVGLILGATNTILFTRSIEAIQLSIAYPVFSGACFAFITLAAAIAFDERLLPINLLGIGLVMVGIILATR